MAESQAPHLVVKVAKLQQVNIQTHQVSQTKVVSAHTSNNSVSWDLLEMQILGLPKGLLSQTPHTKALTGKEKHSEMRVAGQARKKLSILKPSFPLKSTLQSLSHPRKLLRPALNLATTTRLCLQPCRRIRPQCRSMWQDSRERV